MEKIGNIIERSLVFNELPDKVNIKIKDAKNIMYRAFKWHFDARKEKFHPHPAYDKVADWLADNKGKGLFLYGNCGQGKTLLANYILPAVLYYYWNNRKVVNYYKMVDANKKLSEVISKHIIILDDVGVEEPYMEYGNKVNAFSEIMDAVEHKGKLIIITTNLNAKDIEARYGTRTLERIIATCKPICFNLCKYSDNCDSFKIYSENACTKCAKFEPVSFR